MARGKRVPYVRRKVGKLYRAVIKDAWLRKNRKVLEVPAYVQERPGGHYTKEIKIPDGDLVVYLKRETQGFVRVLWNDQVCSMHGQWLTQEMVEQ